MKEHSNKDIRNINRGGVRWINTMCYCFLSSNRLYTSSQPIISRVYQRLLYLLTNQTAPQSCWIILVSALLPGGSIAGWSVGSTPFIWLEQELTNTVFLALQLPSDLNRIGPMSDLAALLKYIHALSFRLISHILDGFFTLFRVHHCTLPSSLVLDGRCDSWLMSLIAAC